MITVLTGANSYAIAQSLRGLTEGFTGTVERFDGSELETRMLPDIFSGATLFATERLIVIKAAANAKPIWTDLEQWFARVPVETHIVLVEPSPDKRTKTYKSLQKHATIREHKELAEHELLAWVQTTSRRNGMELSRDIVLKLVDHVGRDQWRLANELEKLSLTGQMVTHELIQDITEPHPEASAFALLDAVFAGNDKRAKQLFDQIKQSEDPHQFLGLLSSQLFAALAIISAPQLRSDQVATDLKLHPFVVKKLAPAANRLGTKQLHGFIDRLARADERMKSVATEPWQQLEIAIFST